MDLEELCNLWKYQHTEARFTGYLKERIDGYDNGKPYNLQAARKDRAQWLTQIKFGSKDFDSELERQKDEELQKLLHPQLKYVNKKPEWMVEKQRYGENDPLLQTYQCAAKHNLLPNQVNFKLYHQIQTIKERQKKLHTNFVQQFYSEFGSILVQQSPEFWKTLMYELFERLYKSKDVSAENLANDLFTIVPHEKLVKYLTTFKKDISQCLEQSKFFEKTIDFQAEEPAAQKKRGKEKQKGNRWIPQQQELGEVNFIKITQQDLVLKIPTLKRQDHAEYIQFRLEPPPRIRRDTTLIKISESIDKLFRHCFQSQYLNQIQSLVFEQAYNGIDNMLVCAPTGAGKTNIATLTMLNAIRRVASPQDVRIVYISPMKALASQLVQKFTIKFPFLKTRESTGDIQLSQRELATTNILVTTPQKFDVTTRKGGSAMEGLNLLILDQVHLLNDERGWVLESIVARLFRTIERTQRRVRLVGLSATLPNYLDVADFLRVPRESGLFHFDSSYRPVPLLVHFVGVKNPKDSNNNISRSRNVRVIYNEKCYDMVVANLKADKQVLVFVHSRRQTVRFCEFAIDRAKVLGDQHIFKPVASIKRDKMRDVALKKVTSRCVGFHHAGMVRGDRDIVQKMFHSGEIKMLVATATLAWGVNMPAYAVIIKGTDIYDPNQTDSRDISILDVQQMFGRAGRPQYDVSGQATLMTDHAKVNFYIGALTNSSPIDSRFLKYIKQALNAEIVSGTVTSEDDAFDWLKYTFLAVRLKKCPQVYGCARGSNEAQKQFNYDQFIREKVNEVLRELDRMRLIRMDHKNFSVNSTEIGRITSHYYIKCETMAHLCTSLNIFSSEDPSAIKKKFDFKTDLDILNILSQCKEFESISPRLEEIEELKMLTRYWLLEEEPDFIFKKDRTSVNLEDGPLIDTPQKVLLLLQGYLREITFQNFSLVNDTQYVVQNSIRLLRCMLDLCSKKSQAENVRRILEWCKFIQNRVFRDDSPLKQFTKFSFSGYNAMRTRKQMDGFLSNNVYEQFAEANVTVEEVLNCQDSTDRFALLKKMNKPGIEEVRKYCEFIPIVDVDYSLKPIAQTIVKVDLKIRPLWRFNPKWHLKSQVFWVLFDDGQELLHSQTFTLQEEFVIKKREVTISFYVRYKGQHQDSYRLLVTSDRWLGDTSGQEIYINLENLGIEMDAIPFTELLDLQPLPVTALKNPLFENLYNFKFFNPIQTQIFFSLYQTNKNILVGAPTGSGKTIMSELAILNLIKEQPHKKTVYIAPLKALVRQRLKDWQPRFAKIKKSVVQLSGDFTPDIQCLKKADIIVTTPQKWDGITRSKEREYTQEVGLVIFDEIHLLGQERGAVLQVIVSRMNKERKVRMVGLSTAMANGADVAEWFGSDQYGFFNFRPTVRPVPIEIHFQGFGQKHYCPRMATMNRPAFNHIKKFSDGKPVIIFVSSRRQTRLTASDLIAYCQMENRDKPQYVLCDSRIIERAISQVNDQFLKQTLCFGIALHHAGLDTRDREICEQLFVKNQVQVMVATSTLAWGVNFPARLVIIKGTEFFDAKTHKYVDFQSTDLLQMIGRAGRPQFDDKGVAVVYCESSKKNFYRKFLNDPFPIESSLLPQLADHVNAQIARGEIANSQDCIQWITWSFLFRRILKNPTFYGLEGNQNAQIKDFLKRTVDKIFKQLKQSNCIDIHEGEDGLTYVMPSQLGFIASAYYLKHATVRKFSNSFEAGMGYADLLRLMSQAEEFKETPLRHNQDVHNKELSDIAPFKAKNYSSPQDKTLLLLQMHLFNLPFPIRDYLNDCKLILDSCGRVIMGLIDIAKGKRYLDSLTVCIRIQQTLYQGLSCNIPFITYDVWKKIEKKYQGLAGIIENLHNKPRFEEQLIGELKKLLPVFDENIRRKILEGFRSHPVMRMKVKALGFDSQKNVECGQWVQAGGQATILVQIEKQNGGSNRVLCQKHTKIKDVTWWVIVGDSENQLLTIKKVSVKKRVQLKLQIDVPDRPERNAIRVYLLADSYVGLDQVQKVHFKIKEE